MSKRKPTISQPGIDRYFCKSRRTETQEDEDEKTAGDGDRQTPAIPTTSNSTARVDEGEKTADNGDRQTPAIPTTSNSAARVDEGDKTANSPSIHPVLSQVQCEELIKEFFNQGKVHNYYTCFNKCSKLTEQELQRIKPKKFNHDWVEKIHN